MNNNIAVDIQNSFLALKQVIEDKLREMNDNYQKIQTQYEDLREKLYETQQQKTNMNSKFTRYDMQNTNTNTSLNANTNIPLSSLENNTNALSYKAQDLVNWSTKSDEWSIAGMESGQDLMPHNLATQVISMLNQASNIRRLANQITVQHGLSYETALITKPAQTQWAHDNTLAEQTQNSDITVKKINLHHIVAQPAMTLSLRQHSKLNLVDTLINSVTKQMIEPEEESFIKGDGQNKPTGLLHNTCIPYTEWKKWESTGIKSMDVSLPVLASPEAFDILISFISLLQITYLKQGVWLMHPTILEQIRHIKDSSGRHIWERSMQDKAPSRLLGYEVVCSEYMPSYTEILEKSQSQEENNFILLFGDFKSAYTIVDSSKINIIEDPYSKKPLVLFYISKLVGGSVIDNNAYIALTARPEQE